MRVEISQAKKEATEFSLNVDRDERLKSKSSENTSSIDTPTLTQLRFPQKKTEQEYIEENEKKKKRNTSNVDNMDVLKSLFT